MLPMVLLSPMSQLHCWCSRTTTWCVHTSRSFKRVQICKLAIHLTPLNNPSQEKNTLILTVLLITMPCMPKRAAPKVVPSLGSTSADVPPIPSLLECIARSKRKRCSSYVESDDGNAPDDEADDDKVEEEEESQNSSKGTQAVSNQPRLFIKIRIPKRQTDTTKVDNSNGGDESEKEEDSQSLAEDTQAAPALPRLFIKVRLPKKQTDTAKDDKSRDIKSHKKKEDEDSYVEDSSSESSDESDDEYLPPRKRQRTRLQATSKFSSSRVRSYTSVSAAKTKKRV
ncbi:hypothetical protein EDD22DRAFT_472022 [Suillus occidentalis]|nr:hypothetical protein EDD22DRAFT_472022 [Suillus occidentalis]